jgi:hypothetical protein
MHFSVMASRTAQEAPHHQSADVGCTKRGDRMRSRHVGHVIPHSSEAPILQVPGHGFKLASCIIHAPCQHLLVFIMKQFHGIIHRMNHGFDSGLNLVLPIFQLVFDSSPGSRRNWLWSSHRLFIAFASRIGIGL